MSRRKWFLLLFCGLIGILQFEPRPSAQVPVVTFHAIGDLPGGGVASAVRDATRVGGVIYAVGASTVVAGAAATFVPNQDTPALWTWAGSGDGILQALPNTADFTSTQISPLSAYAITPDGAYLASQARPSNATTGTNWVRVTRSLVPDITANLNLSTAPGTPAFAALAISESGGVIYGLRQNLPAGGPETRTPVRYEPGVGFNFPDLTPTGKTWGFPMPRGTSDDGLVMVGAAADGQLALTPGLPLATNAVAFRYVHTGTLTGTTTLIPTLPGGNWNMPVALSATGDRTVVIGNSASYPSGEVYLTDAANNITATLGSPNIRFIPRALGGMTADGSVVGMTFSGAFGGQNQINGVGIPGGNKHAYIHNSHGWFHLSSVLAAHGVDLAAMGWDPTNLAITGIRTVEGVDLVFGQGRRRTVGTAGYVAGAVEGFVAELPVGVLAAFDPAPTPPVDQSIVGAWAVGGDPSNPGSVHVFLANGSYVAINGAGFERGLYTWSGNAAGGAFTLTTLYDTNGANGPSFFYNGRSGLAITVTGDSFTVTDSHCATCSPTTGTRTSAVPGPIVGGWVGGNPAEPDNTFLLVLFGSNAGDKYFVAFDQPAGEDDEHQIGTYTWDPVTHELIVTVGGVVDVGNFVTPSPEGLGLHVVGDDGEEFDLTRIIDPATIPVIADTPLSASGVVGQTFSQVVTATNATTFTATGLPSGLSINTTTGEISGTPEVGGQFAVTIKATSAIGVSDIETLVLTIAIPTPVGQDVVVEPEVPEGQGPVTLSFGEITTAGTTTVTVIDQSEVPAPGNVAIGGVVYEVTTTATYQGLITLCFSYAGIDFGAAAPRLFHFENGVWVDITTSVDGNTQTICGATTTLSPFAVLASNVVRTGFYPPVNPIAGFLNTVKGGSTVPLKFNVSLNGVEQTTTAGLSMTVQAIHCDTSAPQDEVEPAAVVGGTGLRYDAAGGYFIQNWQIPKTPGCYMVRMTTDQDGLALTARFKVR